MKIANFCVENFRGVKSAAIRDAATAVVIAGPNGSGKSCVLDAIRFFKSAYGSYQQSELDLWSNEFQLNWSGRPGDWRGLLRDKSKTMTIEGEVVFSDREKNFMLNDGHWMIRELTWKEMFPQIKTYRGQVFSVSDRSIIEKIKQIEAESRNRLLVLNSELKWNRASGKVYVNPNGDARRDDSFALQVAFTFFVSERMGIIDYHGSYRRYQREQLKTIALKESDEEEKIKSGALYNYESKYANLKSAMAAEYVRELLDRDAQGKMTGKIKPLSKTLEELFAMFLPDKKFKGPVPIEGGEVAFPVWIDNDTQHDINELSSGEKEILFAYLRARTLSPRQSVLLVDEPELHLNPGLVQGLPQFYEKHIGRDLENQIWLVTHSDRFLREALDTAGMTIYHMQHAASDERGNQLKRIDTKSSIESLFIDLVGDLAAFRPDGKFVFLESSESKFDEKMVRRLFPDIAKSINFISVGTKNNVNNLRDTINAMSDDGNGSVELFTVVDPDYEIWSREPTNKGKNLEWSVYHIENYLIDARYIASALSVIDVEGAELISESKIEEILELSAKDLVEDLAVRKVRDRLWRDFRKAAHFDLDDFANPSFQLVAGIGAAVKRIEELGGMYNSETVLDSRLQAARTEFREMWSDGLWKSKFPGRDVLKRLCGKLEGNINYISLRNAIVGEMSRENYRPKDMENIIMKIADA